MEKQELIIEHIRIDALTPYPNNCKIHTREQIEHIAHSRLQFGFNDPLAVAGENNIVLEGNGRIEAAKSLGFKTLPCIRLDFLSKEQQRAYIIAHNALNLETGFNEIDLMRELQELSGYDFSALGVDTEKYFAKLDSLQTKELKPYNKVHYLISLDINLNDKVAGIINSLQNMEGVEAYSSLDENG